MRPPRTLVNRRATVPAAAATTGVPRGAMMSLALWTRPSLRASSYVSGMSAARTPATGMTSALPGWRVVSTRDGTGTRGEAAVAESARALGRTGGRSPDGSEPPTVSGSGSPGPRTVSVSGRATDDVGASALVCGVHATSSQAARARVKPRASAREVGRCVTGLARRAVRA